MARLLLILCVGWPLLSLADRTPVTADQLRRESQSAEQERTESDQRMKTLRSAAAIQQVDTTFIEFHIDGQVFPGLILPNQRVAPAIVANNNQRHPACIDADYTLHRGVFNPVTDRVECRLDPARLLISEDKSVDLYQASTEPPREQPVQPTVSRADAPTEPATEPTSEADESEPQTEQGRAPTAVPQVSRTEPVAPQSTASTRSLPSNVYIPPARSTSTARTRTETNILAVPDQPPFGIRRGTWAEVRVERRVSSADPGEVEITLLETISGQHRDLPSGTLLFARKAFNGRSQRMDMMITTALLPDGREIRVSAYAYDRQRNAGLTGSIIRDREGEVSSALAQGGLTVLSNAANSVPLVSDNPLSSGVDATTQQLIRQEQQNAPRAAQAVIEVSPQTFFIQIAESL